MEGKHVVALSIAQQNLDIQLRLHLRNENYEGICCAKTLIAQVLLDMGR